MQAGTKKLRLKYNKLFFFSTGAKFVVEAGNKRNNETQQIKF
jgi:hypothetical protein